MKTAIMNMFISCIDRRLLWRLGRFLYLKARADSNNDIRHNGESQTQNVLLNRFYKIDEKLVIFDVGANVGDWTWPLLDEWYRLKGDDQLQVYAFEPSPQTFDTLHRRINQHQLHALVHIESLALSDVEGTADMFIVGENAGTNSLYKNEAVSDFQQVEVKRTTAYTYCTEHNIETVHYFKCDTEGHDMEVLLGARKLFEEQRIMVCQFEYNYRWVYSRRFLKDVFDFASNTLYSIGKLTPNGIEVYPKWHPELERFFEGNYVLLHRDAIGWFPTKIGNFDAYNTYHAS